MKEKMSKIFKFIRTFFPLHLLFLQVKHNLFVLFFWFFIFGIINYVIGAQYGLPYLFLSPEYLGKTDFVSFLLLGAGLGGFIMAFEIYSYIQLGPKFPFLATLAHPFYKFMVNNGIIPAVFVINLCVNIYLFQSRQEYITTGELASYIMGLLLGLFLFIIIASLYFLPTNKDIKKMSGNAPKPLKKKTTSNIHASLHRNTPWYKSFLKNHDETYYYFTTFLKVRQSRSYAHYDIGILNKVFTQNHINASVFEILLVISFFSVGLFRDSVFFQVPAGVSILMILTIVVMLVSAFYSWFRMWTYPIILLLFLGVNYISTSTDYFQFKSYAFGLTYTKNKLVDYTSTSIQRMKYSEKIIKQDYSNYLKTLNNWKKRTGDTKPKLILINTSGGGLRSAMWTVNVLRELDSLSDKKIYKNIQMITGASGGMVGASYYRELVLQENQMYIDDRLDWEYLDNMSKDMLNRISFAFSTSDILFRFQKVNIDGIEYSKDRGYAFEQELLNNLGGGFDKRLGDYRQPEKSAEIPTMIFAPTIVNDGRILLIGAQYHGYLQATNGLDDEVGLSPQVENIEYLRFFRNNHPEKIRFTSVLRMSSTFPYIMPMVSMPTRPSMHVMDAGIRDNYGSKISVRYLLSLRQWIKENTSGVIVVKIRDKEKTLVESEKNSYKNIGVIDRLFLPFGNMYGNFPRVQDFDQDEMFSALIRAVDYPIDIVSFNLRERPDEKISLSWHLTTKEKSYIKKAFYSEKNQKSKDRLFELLHIDSK
ncbi:MAG: patatin-like phospholipase family protein [Brumimicrobium sp.]|nr:patatin-like phospholipase family protein [Brumimicrobium sp.]MCO5269097.1 patatin-like phospholipase family protein [Brumimicrobium sp.]